jgi:hypothetical protein
VPSPRERSAAGSEARSHGNHAAFVNRQFTMRARAVDREFPGEVVEEPAATGLEHPLCRAPEPSSFNVPRRLVRMHPAADEPHVAATEYSLGLDLTDVVVCDRAGHARFATTAAGPRPGSRT